MAVIVLDPGHGGSIATGGSSPNNATGLGGTLEKTLTLQVGLLARDALLAKGHTVALTRDTDVNLGLEARANVARAAGADAFLSIHFNGWTDPKVQGTETFVHLEGSSASTRLAQQVQSQTLSATGLANRGVKKMSLGVLTPSRHDAKTAACLVEISFLSDPKEETRLADAAYLQKIADNLATALDTYANSVSLSAAQEDGYGALRAPGFAAASIIVAAGDPIDPVAVLAADPDEPKAWKALSASATMALGFWKDYFKLQANSADIDAAGLARLSQIIRAMSWVESRHGTGAGPGQAVRDPMQCGHPKDMWWKELTGQTQQVDYLTRLTAKGPKDEGADKLPASAMAATGFPAQAALELLGDKKKGHDDAAFGPVHSFIWAIPYFLHRMNTAHGARTYDCGDLARARLVKGAEKYNGGGDPQYGAKIDAALKLVGDVEQPTPAALAAAPATAADGVAETAAAILKSVWGTLPSGGPYRVKVQFTSGAGAIDSVELEAGGASR